MLLAIAFVLLVVALVGGVAVHPLLLLLAVFAIAFALAHRSYGGRTPPPY